MTDKAPLLALLAAAAVLSASAPKEPPAAWAWKKYEHPDSPLRLASVPGKVKVEARQCDGTDPSVSESHPHPHPAYGSVTLSVDLRDEFRLRRADEVPLFVVFLYKDLAGLKETVGGHAFCSRSQRSFGPIPAFYSTQGRYETWVLQTPNFYAYAMARMNDDVTWRPEFDLKERGSLSRFLTRRHQVLQEALKRVDWEGLKKDGNAEVYEWKNRLLFDFDCARPSTGPIPRRR